MAFEINISGEVIPYDGYQGYYCCAELDRQLENANGDDLIVNINSPGGDVDEGFMMYVALRKYAAKYEAHITTYAKGRCYSIATVIFLAGDSRIANRYLSPFIHNAWAYTVGDANQLQKDAADLEMINKKIGLFYAEHTELTYEEAREWMNADTFIEPDECVRIRFATEIEEIVRPAALVQSLTRKIANTNNNKNNNTNMKKKPVDQGFLNKLMRAFNSVEAENAVELNTSTNEPVVFPDLEEGQEPSVGDKGEIDGKPADGSILMADGRTFVFTSGVLSEIVEKEEEETTTMEELQAENQRLKEELAAQNTKLEDQGKDIAEMKKSLSGLNLKMKNLGGLISEYTTANDEEENPDRTKSAGNGNDDGPLETKNLRENVMKYKQKGK
jgi:ATP-dependent protease ClpP protease subunit